MSLTEKTATELLAGLAAKEFSAIELAQCLIEQVEKTAPLGALSHLDKELFRNQAALSDQRRQEGRTLPLDGVPIVIKDNINTSDMPTTAGTGALRGRTPKSDALLVSRLRSTGAVLPAKAVMHELAFGVTSNNATTGPARNPYDASRIPGGSSGGTATSVAARQFPLGIGTDTGASVRLPAALCGLYGFRPSVGRYPRDGIVPISSTRDTPGPMTRSFDDIELLDAILRGRKPNGVAAGRPLTDVRLGIPRSTFWSNLEPGIADVAERVLETLRRAGVATVDVDLTDILAVNHKVGFPVALYEVAQLLPRYLDKAGYGITLADIVDGIESPDVKRIFLSIQGQGAVPETVYREAIDSHRPAMQQAHSALLDTHQLDGLIFPTSPMTARPVGEDETVELNGVRVPTFTGFTANTDLGSNLGIPGISLPAGCVDSLPVGIEIDGRRDRDDDLLAITRQISAFLPDTPRPAAV